MKVKTTYEDGWDCVPELKSAVSELDSIAGIIYEIKNCVRQEDLGSLVDEFKSALERGADILEEIDVNVEYKTEGYEV